MFEEYSKPLALYHPENAGGDLVGGYWTCRMRATNTSPSRDFVRSLAQLTKSYRGGLRAEAEGIVQFRSAEDNKFM